MSGVVVDVVHFCLSVVVVVDVVCCLMSTHGSQSRRPAPGETTSDLKHINISIKKFLKRSFYLPGDVSL